MSKKGIVASLLALAAVALTALAAGFATQRAQAPRQKPASANSGPVKYKCGGAGSGEGLVRVAGETIVNLTFAGGAAAGAKQTWHRNGRK